MALAHSSLGLKYVHQPSSSDSLLVRRLLRLFVRMAGAGALWRIAFANVYRKILTRRLKVWKVTLDIAAVSLVIPEWLVLEKVLFTVSDITSCECNSQVFASRQHFSVVVAYFTIRKSLVAILAESVMLVESSIVQSGCGTKLA